MTTFVKLISRMEGTGWRVDEEEISTIFENNLLFEEILEPLKQQS